MSVHAMRQAQIAGVADLKFSHNVTTRWDDERGELVSTGDLMGQKTREVIKVRAKLQDDILRAAVVIELERLGYIVKGPES